MFFLHGEKWWKMVKNDETWRFWSTSSDLARKWTVPFCGKPYGHGFGSKTNWERLVPKFVFSITFTWRMRCPFLYKPRSNLAMEHLLIIFMYSISTDDFSFSNVEFTSSVIYSTRSFCERFFLHIIWATIESLHPGRCDFCHLEHVHPKRKLRRQERPGNVPWDRLYLLRGNGIPRRSESLWILYAKVTARWWAYQYGQVYKSDHPEICGDSCWDRFQANSDLH